MERIKNLVGKSRDAVIAADTNFAAVGSSCCLEFCNRVVENRIVADINLHRPGCVKGIGDEAAASNFCACNVCVVQDTQYVAQLFLGVLIGVGQGLHNGNCRFSVRRCEELHLLRKRLIHDTSATYTAIAIPKEYRQNHKLKHLLFALKQRRDTQHFWSCRSSQFKHQL